MIKKIALGASALTLAFVGLTAFADQKPEQIIQDRVAARLEELRAQKTKECEEKVLAAANAQAEPIVAAALADLAKSKVKDAAAIAKVTTAAKKKVAATPKSASTATTTPAPAPAPAPTPAPAPPANPKDVKISGGDVKSNVEEKIDKIKGATEKSIQEATESKKKKMGGGN